MMDCTNAKRTLRRSLILIYVEALHSLTQVMAAPSIICLDPPWWDAMAFFTSSMNIF